MAAGEFLLIDNSNSFTKVALAGRDGLVGAPRRVATRQLSRESLLQTLRGWRFESAVLSSVVPKKGKVIESALKGTPVLHVTARVRLGVGIDYPKPRSIGADRLANAACAAATFEPPVVVVDFGTAVSFDIVSAARNYVGGVIAPGWKQ